MIPPGLVGRATALLVVLAVAVAGCSDDAVAPTTTTSTAVSPVGSAPSSTTTVPTYEGDPDSAFCQELIAAVDRPLLDPFAAGIDARELELRLRAVQIRFETLVTIAPSAIADDVELVALGLVTLDDALDRHGYDLGAAAEAGEDLSFLDAPEFAAVATRVAGYQDQVCAG
ncbi:MAG: hypothetical protein OSA99_17065 [Acidimicrobiales bacterium]|nr:hypothetical protein [Acidimicrobiales bacterium]